MILIELNGSAVKKAYIYANGQIIAQHDGAPATDNKYFYLHDRLGSVRQIINYADSQVNVKNRYTYKPFGELFEKPGEDETEETVTNSFKFTGQYYDDEIGQYYLRARQYDPYLARFTARDPVFGRFEEPLSLHKYLYCGNNAMNQVDPSGLWGLGLRDYLERTGRVEDAWRLSDWDIMTSYDRVWRDTSRHTWHGHSDLGFRQGDFDYTTLDRQWWTTPWLWPLGTDLHFGTQERFERGVQLALRSGDNRFFEQVMHAGQDYFSHYNRGWRWYTFGHIAVGHEADNPYTISRRRPEAIRYFHSDYRAAQRWTKYWEECWYLIWENDKWISLL